MITATLDRDIFLVLYGNTSITLHPESFVIIKDGTRMDNSGVINIRNTPSKLCSISGGGTRNLTITGYKHINSTSLQDDSSNGHPNVLSDDLTGYDILDLIVEIAGNWGSVEVRLPIIYYASPYPPNIDISRLRGVLKSTGNDYYSIFTNATINNYSILIPDKASPYSAGDIIGYCPNAEGNFIIYKSPNIINVSWKEEQIPISFTILRMGKIDNDITGLHMNIPLGQFQSIPIDYFNYSFTQKITAITGTYSGELIAETQSGLRAIAPFSFSIIKEEIPLNFTNGSFVIPDRFTANYIVTVKSTYFNEIQLFGKVRLHTSTGVTDWIPSGGGQMQVVPPNSTNTYTYSFDLPENITYYIVEIRLGDYNLVSTYYSDRIILSI